VKGYREGAIELTALKMLMAGALLGGSLGLTGLPAAQADPFTPAEMKLLNDVRPTLPSYGDARASSLSDTDLAGEGWSACRYLASRDSPQ
jgi:hypothetical protein